MAVLSANTCPPPGPLVLNRKHKLAKASLRYAIPVNNAGTIYDRARGVPLRFYNTATKAGGYKYGLFVEGGKTTAGYRGYFETVNDVYRPVVNNVTMLAVGFCPARRSTNIIYSARRTSNNGKSQTWTWNIYSDSGKVGVDRGGKVYTNIPTPLSPVVLCCRDNSVTFDTFTDYGVFDSVGTSIKNDFSGVINGIVLFAKHQGSIAYFGESTLSLFLFYEEVLSDSECWDLVYDPWMLFRPHREVVAFNLSAATIATIFRRSNTLQNRIGTRMPV